MSKKDDTFVPGSISPQIDAASEALFPNQLTTKPMAQMTPEELFQFMNMLLGGSAVRHILETDNPGNKEFMEAACEAWGNNGEAIQHEDSDTYLDETDAKNERGE